MKKSTRILALALALVMALGLTACGSKETPETKDDTQPAVTAFEPRLDTEASVNLDAAVFFGNFEAFDQVINHFNEYYPNVVITYDNIGRSTVDLLDNNPYLDIFMTSEEPGYDQDGCADLLAAGVDVSAVADGLLKSSTVDGKLLTLPMGLRLQGMVVNKTLLEKEGLTVPQTWSEFLSVLEALKQKGYTPIQGPAAVMGTLAVNMGMSMLNSDPALYQAVMNGDAEGAAALKTAYSRLAELQEKGYISNEVNAAYPEDNYEGAILNFFEGDVPFWVCDTEKVSGMKKRESKSESFTANPFEYEFMYVPMGDSGVYEYIEPWYGFAVNKNSDALDYALEFLRFMAREDELNTLASVKGVPSIAKNAPDERYTGIKSLEKVEQTVVYDGSVPSYIGTLLSHAGNDMISGGTGDADAALAAFVEACAASVQ